MRSYRAVPHSLTIIQTFEGMRPAPVDLKSMKHTYIMDILEGNLEIVCLQECFEYIRNDLVGLCLDTDAHPDSYYMLFHDADRLEVVGYLRIRREWDRISILEYEIFQEFRGRGFGKLFAKKILEYRQFLAGLYIEEWNLAKCAFWCYIAPTFFFRFFGKKLGYTMPYCTLPAARIPAP